MASNQLSRLKVFSRPRDRLIRHFSGRVEEIERKVAI